MDSSSAMLHPSSLPPEQPPPFLRRGTTGHTSLASESFWRIRLIVSDLDGTLVKTYKTLGALHHIMQELGECMQRPNDPIQHYTDQIRDQIRMRDILHAPEESLPKIVSMLVKAEGEAGRIEGGTPRNGTKVHIDKLLEQGLAMAHESFRTYCGARRVMDQANLHGTGFVIHTATKAEAAVRRLTRSTELNLDHISLVFARTDNEEEFSLPWRKNLTDPRAIAFAEKLVPYMGKKSCDQVSTLLKMFDVTANEMLYVGESATDYNCIQDLHGQHLGYFAYQEEGGRMTSEKIVVNDSLREHRLGHEHFMKTHPELHLKPHVIVLKEGWVTLHEAIAHGRIALEDLLPNIPERSIRQQQPNRQATTLSAPCLIG